MKYKNKIIFAVTLISLISLLLSSCGLIKVNTGEPPETEPPETTSPPRITDTDPPIPVESERDPIEFPEPEKWEIRKSGADEYLKNHMELDYTGKSIYIVDGVGTFSDPLVENNVYSEARYERNKMLTEKYGFEVVCAGYDIEKLYDDYAATLKIGESFSDILSVPLKDTARYITSGLVENLRTLPFFEATGKYAIDSFETSKSAANDMFYSIGYGTLDPDDLGCIYFNRAMIENAGLDLYSEVRAGEFTFERYLQILTETELTTSNTSKFDIPIMTLDLSPEKFFKSGYRVWFSFSAKTFKSAAESAAPIYSTFMTNAITLSEGESAEAAFEAQKCAFLYGTLGQIEQISERKILFGLLPIPKLNKDTPYQTPVSNSMAALMIPINNGKAEMCSVALSAINAASHRWLLDSAGLLYGVYYTPDIKSIDMIKIILETPVLDFSAGSWGLAGLYDSVLFEGVRRKAASLEDTLSDLYTTKNLNALKKELNAAFS